MSEANNNTTTRALAFTLMVSFFCALLVSVVSVKLRPIQQANIEAERIAQLEQVTEALNKTGSIQTIASLEARVVELDSGNYIDGIDVSALNSEGASNSAVLSASADLAGIKRRELYAQVYLVFGPDQHPDLIILPVRGRGYQSTLYAWLVLNGDTQSVRAFKVYRHGETPGVGSRITEPEWEALWKDQPVFDDQRKLRIKVGESAGATVNAYAKYQVDGITGATRTIQGVDGMVRFWLGESGFGPYLKRLAQERQ